MRQAYLVDLVQARAYIDGREEFGADLSFDLAADITSESFLWRLAEVALSITVTAIQGVALPLAIELGYLREIEDRLLSTIK